MSEREWVLLYRCRLCNETVKLEPDYAVDDDELSAIQLGVSHLSTVGLHACTKGLPVLGRKGFADLVGAERKS